MPITFAPAELVNAYTQRQNQCRQEAIGHNLVIAEANANPDLSADAKAVVVAASSVALATLDVAYDAAGTLLDAAQSDLDALSPAPA